jgi:hypothetical protein
MSAKIEGLSIRRLFGGLKNLLRVIQLDKQIPELKLVRFTANDALFSASVYVFQWTAGFILLYASTRGRKSDVVLLHRGWSVDEIDSHLSTVYPEKIDPSKLRLYMEHGLTLLRKVKWTINKYGSPRGAAI